MRIINLQAENIKILVAVDITPKDCLVQITGKNGAGKTSILDCIWWALEGAKNIQSEPIRRGATEAFIQLKIGEKDSVKLIVMRTFKKKENGEYTTRLTITNKDGEKVPGGGQAMLDGFLDALSFDPLEFKRMKPKEQFDLLKQFVPYVDFDGIENMNRADYEDRKDINREAKRLASAASEITSSIHQDYKFVDENDLIKQISKAGEHNADIQLRKNNRKILKSKIMEKQAAIEQLSKEVDEMQRKLENAKPLPVLIDVRELENKVRDVRANNAEFNKAEEKKKLLESAHKLELESEAITEKMKLREDKKKEAISKANIPVKGISFGDGIILLNGVPFDQASDAEQLKACISIGMARNPELKVIRMRDGSLLDEESENVVRETAKEFGFDVWQEKVDSSGKIGFVIEDGRVKGDEEEEDF